MTAVLIIGVVFPGPAAHSQEGLERAREALRESESRRIAVFERAAASVVCIFADRNQAGGGSGVVIHPDGYGLTNFHVVAEFLEKRQGFGGMADGKLYPLAILGIDPGGDVAMFKLDPAAVDQVVSAHSNSERGTGNSARQHVGPMTGPSSEFRVPSFPFAPLGDSDIVRLGDWVAAMGNPFVVAEDYTPTITWGIVSGVQRYQSGQGNALEYADCIQVSTSINPGNSGGPLFDMQGRVIGINGRASFEERGRVNVGLGYAISINQVKRFIPALRGGQLCEHGALGATVARVGDSVIFDAVQEAGPAARAGVALGDRIAAVGGRPIRSPNEFLNVLTPMPANWPVTVRVEREGKPIDATARLERLPVRMPTRYLVDFKHNHQEIERLLERFERGCRAGDRLEEVTWRGWVEFAGPGKESARRTAVQVGQREDGILAAALSPGAPEGSATDSPSEGRTLSGDAEWTEFWNEWAGLTRLLLNRPKITLGWELLGGDAVDGQIVYVVEHRRSEGERFRWKFDAQTAELRAMAVGTEADPEKTQWRVSGKVEGQGLTWPAAWARESPNGRTTIRVESIVAKNVSEQGTRDPDAASPATQIQNAQVGYSWAALSLPDERSNAAGQIELGSGGPDLISLVAAAQTRVVKLYGAAIGREHGYGCGTLVSADGLIVTALSLLLESPSVRAVLPDGTQHAAKVLARDESRQLALLKIDAAGLPHFTLSEDGVPSVGTWAVAAGNPFKVAEGAEPVSVVAGVISAQTTMSGRRRAQDFPYTGPILLIDAIVSTPGFAGGPVLNADGRVVGIVGKAAISELTNTWVNYCLPVSEVAAFLRQATGASPGIATGADPLGREGETRPDGAGTETARQPADAGKPDLGIRLFDIGGQRRPAYVDRVRPNSPAAAAGVRKNDLVVSIGGRLLNSAVDYQVALEGLRPGEKVELVLKRKDELVTVELTVGAAP